MVMDITPKEKRLRNKIKTIEKAIKEIKSVEPGKIAPELLQFVLRLLGCELKKANKRLGNLLTLEDLMEEDAMKEEERRLERELEDEFWVQMGENR